MSARTLAMQRAWLRACFGPSAELGDDVDERDRVAIGERARRLGLYRILLRQNVSATAASILPRTKALVDGAAPGAFAETVARFLDERGPRTHHLRDVPGEIVAFVRTSGFSRAESLPEHAVALAELEWADFEVNVAPRPPVSGALADLAPSRAVALAGPIRLVRQRFDLRPLFEGSASSAHSCRPELSETRLLLYRDDAHATRWMALSVGAWALVDSLAQGHVLAVALERVAAASGSALDDSLLAGVAALLSDLASRGVVLGAIDEGLRADPLP